MIANLVNLNGFKSVKKNTENKSFFHILSLDALYKFPLLLKCLGSILFYCSKMDIVELAFIRQFAIVKGALMTKTDRNSMEMFWKRHEKAKKHQKKHEI